MLLYERYNPPLNVRNIRAKGKTFKLIDDSYLECGTKQRGLAFFEDLKAQGYQAIVTSAARTGYGQIATSWMCNVVGLECNILYAYGGKQEFPFMDRARAYGAKQYSISRPDKYTITITQITPGNMKSFGAGKSLSLQLNDEDLPSESPADPKKKRPVFWVSNNMQNIAIEHMSATRTKCKAINSGLDDDNFIIEMANSITLANIDRITPKVIWLVVGSGTILRALHLLWPNAKFMCVQVGRTIYPEDYVGVNMEIIDHQKITHEKFMQGTAEDNLPPYDSVASYDAKLWIHARDQGKSGDYIWNVAKD